MTRWRKRGTESTSRAATVNAIRLGLISSDSHLCESVQAIFLQRKSGKRDARGALLGTEVLCKVRPQVSYLIGSRRAGFGLAICEPQLQF